jgi:hypothetical protein
MSELRRWASCGRVAEIYGWHPKTVQKLCAQRRIPFCRLPSTRGGRGQIRVDLIALEQLLEASTVRPAAAPLDNRRRKA